MHFTLHLTNKCNMACDYCYVDGCGALSMSFETARKAVELASSGSNGPVGIIFFGGEPLLEKDLIRNIVQYCRTNEKQSNCRYHFKITTNGTLLDLDFMEFADRNRILVAMSHDGVREAHNRHRVGKDRQDTFELLSPKVDLLLSHQPYAPVLMTVNPDTVRYYADSVRYLYARGFKYIICSLNYAGHWEEVALSVLREQYLELSDFYLEKTKQEDKFYLSPFEVKISSHINKSTYCRERCELGKKQISVGPDGTLYPCVQFVGDRKYAIGNVFDGIDREHRLQLFLLNEQDKTECKDCAVADRCNHHCGCLNKQATGRLDRVSPVLCAHERILLPIADALAAKLFKSRDAMFIQKHYNDMYPLISLIEDKVKEPEGKMESNLL